MRGFGCLYGVGFWNGGLLKRGRRHRCSYGFGRRFWRNKPNRNFFRQRNADWRGNKRANDNNYYYHNNDTN